MGARIASIVLLFVLLLGTSAPASGQGMATEQCHRAPRPGADPRFGVAEAWRNLPAAQRLGASWERVVFSWQHIQPDPETWNLPHYFKADDLCGLLDAGFEVVGLLQDTPEWASARPFVGATSPPLGLYAPWDSPDNLWARFVERMASEYRGKIDRWIIWNEPEFMPDDQGGIYLTWSGGALDYYQLLKTAYLAAKAGNPNATVVFASTSYWIDVVNGREQFLERVLDIARGDPDARAQSYFFDAVALNVYWAPDDIWGLARILRQTLQSRGLEKALWITETNAPPYDDPATPKPPNGQRVTLREQAAFTIQALALGFAAGYERIGWHAMIDRDTADEIWGLTRNDGTLRPAYTAYQVAVRYLSNAERATFRPLDRPTRPAWVAADGPNWRVYLVAFDRGRERVSVLWNGEGVSHRVRLPQVGAGASVVDHAGQQTRLLSRGGYWEIDLPPATARGPLDPPDYYYVGGDPRLLVEVGVPPGSPVVAPEISRQ